MRMEYLEEVSRLRDDTRKRFDPESLLTDIVQFYDPVKHLMAFPKLRLRTGAAPQRSVLSFDNSALRPSDPSDGRDGVRPLKGPLSGLLSGL